jgi:adenylosuccinate synthase
MSLWVIVGGQYGSEGKGKVSAFITQQENIDICVRCGGPNSGHSFVDENGKTIVLRQLSTGYVNPRTRLLIPAGALIDPMVLKHEIDSLSLAPERIGIDRKSFIIEAKDREKEQALGLRERLSSTLCGVGAAQSRRVLRSEDARLARDVGNEHPWLCQYLTDVSDEVNTALDHERKVLIEGTQGFGLSLYHSDHYPKTTSRDTTAAGFISEVGVSPMRVTEIIVVFRTFPIRVAGQQAGPLNEELTWEQIRKDSGYPHPIEERTSVTHKVRRVGRFDKEFAKNAFAANHPTRFAINGLDLLNYSDHGVKDFRSLSQSARLFIGELSALSRCERAYFGTGPRLVDLFCEELCSKENLEIFEGSVSTSR